MIDDARAETAYQQIYINPALLREGPNTLAVEVHQAWYAYPPSVTYPDNSYSDMRFDLRIIGITPIPEAAPTLLSLTTPGTTVIRSRVKNGSLWSGLTESIFIVQTVPATAANLVISEFHYRPGPLTLAETAAGHLSENVFEYLELLNIHPTANLDLSGLAFTRGITFLFSQATPESRYLPPGAPALLVANPTAFATRLAPGATPLIAGTYTGSLNNGGENLTLLDATGTIIKSFTYDNNDPWPTDADGIGRTLVLIHPLQNPDHTQASNWRASTSPHGTPGTAETPPPLPPDPTADDNGNGFPNLIEHLMGSQPALTTSLETYLPDTGVPDTYLLIRFPRDLTAGPATLAPELATSPEGVWSTAALTFVGWSPAEGTQSSMTWRSTQPISTLGPHAFIRLRATP